MAKKQQQQQFKILVEQGDDGVFVASVPSLPGCHTQAKTLPQLKIRVREAIELCLEVAKEDRDYREQIRQFAYDPTFVGLEVVSV